MRYVSESLKLVTIDSLNIENKGGIILFLWSYRDTNTFALKHTFKTHYSFFSTKLNANLQTTQADFYESGLIFSSSME